MMRMTPQPLADPGLRFDRKVSPKTLLLSLSSFSFVQLQPRRPAFSQDLSTQRRSFLLAKPPHLAR
jgi:hypothetical protein